MQVDIVGRVNNLKLPLTQPCIPLFECLANSIESIEDAKVTDGRIEVYIERDSPQHALPATEEAVHYPIRAIAVVDNGAGFTDENSRAFFMSDSTNKANRGNKGIGRFTWLKVFEKAAVDSVYRDGETWSKRAFDFVMTRDGVVGEQVSEASSTSLKTSVRLTGLRNEYQKFFPKTLETIGQKVIDHLLIHFVNGSCPQITLIDIASEQRLNLNEAFRQEFTEHADKKDFSIGSLAFTATILRYQSSAERQHTISYCANQREVIGWKAGSVVPDLKVKLTDEQGQQFVFKTYVTGSYLDDRVNSERTDFLFSQDEDLDYEGEMTRKHLDDGVVKCLLDAAEPYMKTLRKEKRESIENFVQHTAPQYRIVLNERYMPHLEKIAPNLKEDQLDIELYKTIRNIEIEHRQKATKIRTPPPESATGAEEYHELYTQYLDEENELGKAALAKYVVHRRTILELLDGALKIQENGKYAREDFVHSLIYPMQAMSDDVEFRRQNLWVVDERLAYHFHLASDLPLSRLKGINTKENDEPDLVVFNTPRAFSETTSPFQSVVIVEFKRPERNEYKKGEEDPIEQVLRYVRKIKEGKAKDKDQKTINVGAIPFYAYVLCSLTPRVKAILDDNDFVKTPDNEGYFKYHQNAGCYIEVLSYDKVLNDAKKRNRAFFETLNIPMK